MKKRMLSWSLAISLGTTQTFAGQQIKKIDDQPGQNCSSSFEISEHTSKSGGEHSENMTSLPIFTQTQMFLKNRSFNYPNSQPLTVFAVPSVMISFLLLTSLTAFLSPHLNITILGYFSTLGVMSILGTVIPAAFNGENQIGQLKRALRADLRVFYSRNANLRKSRKQLPLEKELKALPGSGQEHILGDYYTLTDIAQLATFLREMGSKVVPTSNDQFEKTSVLIDQIHEVQTKMNEAMAEYLIFSSAPPDEKPCDKNLKCQKFKTILWTIIDSDSQVDARAKKVIEAKKLAAVLDADLREARSEAVALVTYYRQAVEEVKKSGMVSESESESVLFADRLLLTQTSLDDFEASIQKLSDYITNVQAFENELMKREGGKIPTSDQSLRIDW